MWKYNYKQPYKNIFMSYLPFDIGFKKNETKTNEFITGWLVYVFYSYDNP